MMPGSYGERYFGMLLPLFIKGLTALSDRRAGAQHPNGFNPERVHLHAMIIA
eukprot:gene17964-biopygen12887